MPVLESSIQRAVVEYAKRRGWRPYKRSTVGRYGSSGDPDYEFNGRGARTFFIEFKRPGGKPTARQEKRMDELCELGFSVYVIDSVKIGKEIVDEETEDAAADDAMMTEERQ